MSPHRTGDEQLSEIRERPNRDYRVGSEPVPQYCLLRELSRSAFGSVWKAMGPGGVEVAIRFVNLHIHLGPKEFRAIRRLTYVRHPYLATVFDCWLKSANGALLNRRDTWDPDQNGCELIIAMSLGERSLYDRLLECRKTGERALPLRELIHHMTQAASAIDFLNDPHHDLGEGVVGALQHGNISPSDILTAGGVSLVANYGLVPLINGSHFDSKNDQPMYSPIFASPEIINGVGASPLSDQYSLAVSLVKLLTDRLPYAADKFENVVAQIGNGELLLDFFEHAPRAVLRKALAQVPQDRYPTCLEFVREFQNAFGGVVNRIVDPILVPGKEIVPGYKINRRIGRSGFGEFWEAKGPGKTNVGVKVVKDIRTIKGRRELAALEAISNGCNHPNLMNIHAYWLLDAWGDVIQDAEYNQLDGLPPAYLVLLTKVVAKTLSQRLNECQKHGIPGIPQDELLEYMRQAAKALDYLNTKNNERGENEAPIAHCDINPENIYLTRSGDVKVSDIALALKLHGPVCDCRDQVESSIANYAAPELFHNTVTRWTDQYSLALTYYYLRTGYIPMDTSQILLDQWAQNVVGNQDINCLPEKERAVVSRATRLKPSERFENCSEFVAALFTAANLPPPALSPASFGQFNTQTRNVGATKNPPALKMTKAVASETVAIHMQSETVRSRPKPSPDEAFSSQTVVLHFPAPIAIAYRRFCARREPGERLKQLFAAFEMTVRYLVYLGLADLFHCRVRGDGPVTPLPPNQEFNFTRRNVRMTLNQWVQALLQTATELSRQSDPFIPELAEVCGRDGYLGREIMPWLRNLRIADAHPEAGTSFSSEEVSRWLVEARPRMEQLFQKIAFVRRYPLGFMSRGYETEDDRVVFHVHSCMGARIAHGDEAFALETSVRFAESVPFIVNPTESAALYLWPFLLQRESDKTQRPSLYVFEHCDESSSHLSKVHATAIDHEDRWDKLFKEVGNLPADSHDWLWQTLRDLPAVVTITPELRLVEGLTESATGVLSGKRLGPYRLLSPIARGGFGTVYDAVNEDAPANGEDERKRVAVKVLEARDAFFDARDRRTQFERFRKEYEKLHKASAKSGIIRCYEQGISILSKREYPWYAMEFAAGGDLGARLEERRIANRDAIAWHIADLRPKIIEEFRAIVKAVAGLHELQIVHRDIKPGNVLILEGGELRLSDFGLVKDMDRSARTGMSIGPGSTKGAVLGTRDYMAPEQERGDTVDLRADIYSLGIVLAELAIGRRPRPDPLISSGSPIDGDTHLHSLPPTLRDLITRCTDIKPEKRLEDAGYMTIAFERAVAAVPDLTISHHNDRWPNNNEK